MIPKERGPKVSVRFTQGALSTLRGHLRLTQKNVAEQACIDEGTVRRAEKGTGVSQETAFAIASVLSIDLATVSDYTAPSANPTRPLQPNTSSKSVPRTLALTTQRANPQWADYRDYVVDPECPWVLRCLIATESPYFRFGFKLLSEQGRVFGDGLIQSYDANLVLHIGRNNFDRPKLGISAHDIFLTTYINGVSVDDDSFLFTVEQKLVTSIALLVDETYRVNMSVNNQLVAQRIVPPAVCQRLVILAWGDREEFDVDVTELSIEPIRRERRVRR